MAVYRIYVEKKPQFAVEAHSVLSDIHTALGYSNVKSLRVLNRYDADELSLQDFENAKTTIFSEPQVDDIYDALPELEADERVFATEYLPGQFDQRADSCAQCIQISTQKDRPMVRTARVFIFKGVESDEQFEAIKRYLINPVESREASLDPVETLKVNYDIPTEVETLTGFITMEDAELAEFVKSYGLAMDVDDLHFCRDYFRNEEHRDPTITEIRMIDTYWSDHCRHTTFSTNIDNVSIAPSAVKEAYDMYVDLRSEVHAGKNKPMTLMDIATIGAKALKKQGYLKDMDESEEINACSVKIKVDVDGEDQDWLLMFKNETHNHPTEIEPFGGAATCLGGAIRDPLSGRSYVYQAMRVTGAADPLLPTDQTMEGKLPQRKICTTAASGYSSYGNQIGLATGHVAEVYHEGYVAKRLEIGAVVGAAPAENVRREVPAPGDVVVLLGGKTGRDGCGGATGSSKSHTMESLESCGAEVQKGNAPEERKLQRLFRDKKVTSLIKRCNDFGAGGVSVAIGELADGLDINLSAVPKKYDGLDGTELAISESQERMAVVVAAEDVEKFVAYASAENLDAKVVATVKADPRLTMTWNDKVIVDLSREFLNSNGASKHTEIVVNHSEKYVTEQNDAPLAQKFADMAADLNVCSQKGLVERFDSTIGAGTVTMPFAGTYQLTPTQAMAAKIPVLDGVTQTCSIMGWGYNPYVSEKSPYIGAMSAVIESVAKVIAAGGSWHHCWLTFQEYFERTQNNPERWGKPFMALLGALKAQMELKIASIGGKDSMSGTFEKIDVPPTLVSFAVSTAKADKVLSPEFKKAGNKVVALLPKYNEDGTADFASIRETFDCVENLIASGKAVSVWTIGFKGVAEGLLKMALGNRLGFKAEKELSDELLFAPCYGGFLMEVEDAVGLEASVIGEVADTYALYINGAEMDMLDLQAAWENKLEPVYSCNIPTPKIIVPTYTYRNEVKQSAAVKIAQPRVLIPVFPGTNCEYDTARVYENAGAKAEVFVIKNLSAADIEESVSKFAELVRQSQIIAIPGGFSGGDEPDGSGKFITSFFRNPMIKDAVHELLKNRDGLMCGICNGFQALIKLGLVPYGEIIDTDDTCPTLTYNTIGRHQSMMVRTRVASNKSPWFYNCNVGDIHTVAISHGEGRFVGSAELIAKLAENGQIATQYVDLSGCPTNDIRFNPNTSIDAIEGITSPDGRVLGKMAHSERIGSNICKNVPGEKDQKIFQSAVEYFTK